MLEVSDKVHKLWQLGKMQASLAKVQMQLQ
jgi:hypothetical protein